MSIESELLKFNSNRENREILAFYKCTETGNATEIISNEILTFINFKSINE